MATTKYIINNLSGQTIDGDLTINGNINVTGEGEGIKLYGENFIFVPTAKNSTMYDPITNGANLTAAYSGATLKTPNGLPLSESNRYTVLLAPGVYNLAQPLSASTEYVDLVSITGKKDVFLSAATTPLLVLADNIKLVGLSVYEYDFIVLSEFRNVIVENCGNGIFTMDRNTRSEKKYYYYLWDALSGEPNPFTGLTNILYYDYASPKGRNKAVSLNLNGGINLLKSFVSSKFNGSGLALMDGYAIGEVGGIFNVVYDSLTGGTLNIGDELVFDGTGSLIGEILAIQENVIYISTISGGTNGDETTFTDTDTSATANVTSITPQSFNINGTASTSITTSISSNYMTINIYPSIGGATNNGPNMSVDLDFQPTYHVGYISFSGNPASFIGDAFITNDLGGTAQISDYYGTGILLSYALTGQWENATTIQGNNTLNICNITEFSSETEYNFTTEIIFDVTSDTNTYRI
jgi:hypothetical protein